MPVLLSCKNLSFGYGGKPFAEPLNFELQAGEVVALMGENGSGKSTLLKTVAGHISALSGEVSLSKSSGEFLSIDKFISRELAKNIALVRMSGVIPDRMTVEEFVSLGRAPYAGIFDGRSSEDLRVVKDAMDLLELNLFADRLVSSLSDGERSRVYLAEAVAQQVKVLLLDEPNAFLDIPRSHRLFKLLRSLAAERDVGVVVSTHSVDYAKKYCDRLMVIHKGVVRVENVHDAETKGLLDWTYDEE